jgi:uncharacterized protein YbcI
MNAKSEILRVEFFGNDSEKLAVPMSEVGHTLVALQQMIYKCYLYQQGRLIPGARLNHRERDACALEVVSIEEGSVIFTFDSLMDIGIRILKYVLPILIAKLIDYKKKRVPKLINKKEPTDTQLPKIFLQAEEFARKIDGKIQSIVIIPTNGYAVDRIVIDADFSNYIKSLKKETLYGKRQPLRGFIKRIDLVEGWAEIITEVGRRVRVSLEKPATVSKILSKLCKQGERDTPITFKGRPVYRIGSDLDIVVKFEANQIA